ncbi:MAG: phospho-N-acetylmuramoyl-pentapeptide-transferase [Lentisphaeria bacterium]|nr:phospho-N-acetylmuramoyl-pentapeptide-transferase [Lentisphaeria bacterium]
MLYFLAELRHLWGPLRLFEYITFRAGAAAFTAFLIVALLGSWTARKLKQMNMQAASRYEGILPPEMIDKEKEKTPCMGGLLLIGGVIISALLWMNLTGMLSWIFIISTLEFMIIGFCDDYKKVFLKQGGGISGKAKLVAQTVVAVMTVFSLIYLPECKKLMLDVNVPFMKEPLFHGYIWSVPLAVLAVVSSCNAVNLTDGKDGLASGCMIFCMLTYSAIAYMMGHKFFAEYLNIPSLHGVGEAMVFGMALIGGCIGFLWHNCKPASMFMGDTGSLALGGALGTFAVVLRQELLLILAGGVFVMEAVSVVLQVGSFKLFNKRIFLCTPIHHHFEKKGWTETQIVVRFWILSGLFALMALASLKLR